MKLLKRKLEIKSKTMASLTGNSLVAIKGGDVVSAYPEQSCEFCEDTFTCPSENNQCDTEPVSVCNICVDTQYPTCGGTGPTQSDAGGLCDNTCVGC